MALSVAKLTISMATYVSLLACGFLFSHCQADHWEAHTRPQRQHSVALRRRTYPTSWSLTHLSRLRELTLRGESADKVMSGLLRSRATAVLPASLQTLRRQDPTERFCIYAMGRYSIPT